VTGGRRGEATGARTPDRTNGHATHAPRAGSATAGEGGLGAPTAGRWRNWLAWAGAAPLGAFLVVHMVTASSALAGRARFQSTFATSPVVKALIVALVLAPLAFHALHGSYVALAHRAGSGRREADAPAVAKGTFPRLRHVAALGALAFLTWHLVALPLRGAVSGLRADSLFDVLASDLSSTTLGVPVRALAYLLGLSATAFHLAASLWMLGTDGRGADDRDEDRVSGVPTSSASSRPSASFTSSRARDAEWYAWGAGALGAVVFLLGAHTVVFFATGTRLLPLPYPPVGGALMTSSAPSTSDAPGAASTSASSGPSPSAGPSTPPSASGPPPR
jgi:hypothetical protein